MPTQTRITTRSYADRATALVLGGDPPNDTVEHFVTACPDDVSIPTVEFLETELNEAWDHADPTGNDPAIQAIIATAVYLAKHPGADRLGRPAVIAGAQREAAEGEPIPDGIRDILAQHGVKIDAAGALA